MRPFERIQARSFVFFFPPLTVSMTRVHHASSDSLNWVRHFQWLDPSKSLAASSLEPPHPLVFLVRENSEGLPTYPDPAKPSNTSRVAFVFTPEGTAILNLWYRSLRCSDTEKLRSLVKVKGGPCPSVAEHAESFSLISDGYALRERSLDKWLSAMIIYACQVVVICWNRNV